MSEYSENKNGQIKIADEVIAIIAATAAAEVEGVIAAGSKTAESFVEFFGKKNLAKGVKVSVEENEASVDIEIAIKFGIKLVEAAKAVQLKIKNAVETMTGLSVSTVNVTIYAVIVEKEKEKDETEI